MTSPNYTCDDKKIIYMKNFRLHLVWNNILWRRRCWGSVQMVVQDEVFKVIFKLEMHSSFLILDQDSALTVHLGLKSSSVNSNKSRICICILLTLEHPIYLLSMFELVILLYAWHSRDDSMYLPIKEFAKSTRTLTFIVFNKFKIHRYHVLILSVAGMNEDKQS